MTIVERPRMSSNTLTQRIAEGRIPAPEVLRHASALAESIRKMHNDGRVHGAINPSLIVVDGPEWELLPATHSVADSITPYTAPEVVHGKQPDVRSDIFSFGAILYELLSGHRAFDGDNLEDLATSIVTGTPERLNKPEVDRLISACLTKDPSARYQSMQKLLMELKLLAAAARRSDSRTPRAQLIEVTLRNEMRQLEERLSDQLESYQGAVLEGERAAREALKRLQDQLGAISNQLAIAQDTAKEVVRESIAWLEKSTQANTDRVLRIEHSLETFDQDLAATRESVNMDIRTLERTVRGQASAIECARSAISQTDDLVEGVLDELESLQSAVLGDAAESLHVNRRG
jgi:hypothetical protein